MSRLRGWLSRFLTDGIVHRHEEGEGCKGECMTVAEAKAYYREQGAFIDLIKSNYRGRFH